MKDIHQMEIKNRHATSDEIKIEPEKTPIKSVPEPIPEVLLE
jgi:hypothetical protein